MDALLELLSQHWSGVLFRQRPDLTFEQAGPRLAELTGIALEEWRTRPGLLLEVVHELDLDLFRRHLEDAATRPDGAACAFRVRHRTTGRVSYIDEHRRIIRDANGTVLHHEGFWTDVTRQALAERRLASAAWKETLGLVTQGLAHDFNNVLAGILGLSETFLMQIDDKHPFHHGLQLVKSNSHHAAQLIRRIDQLHRAKTGVRSYQDLNALVQEGAELLGKVIPKRIEIAAEPAAGQLPLYVDPVEFQQTLLNLALNAADAMPERGKLILRTWQTDSLNDVSGEHRVGAPSRLPAACLEMTDTGRGIQSRLLPFIFDPFFTTKPMNRGSGLGLYNARLFAEKHTAGITVRSAEGKGTTLRLWFPIADFTEAEAALALSNRRRRCLLLAGRAGQARAATAEFLRSNNYLVVPAAEDAEDWLRSGDYSFDGILLLAEPGDDLALRITRFIRQHQLPLKIILKTTGGNPDEIDPQLSGKCDLHITPDLAEDTLLDRLAETLEQRDPK